MKKDRKAQTLKLNRETLRDLDKTDLPAVAGGAEALSVRFCTLDVGCTTSGLDTGTC